jgi:hypothetical protein
MHTIKPRDKNGYELNQVSSIAARCLDQLVCVDSVNQRVIVNNFDGQYIGKFTVLSEMNPATSNFTFHHVNSFYDPVPILGGSDHLVCLSITNLIFSNTY